MAKSRARATRATSTAESNTCEAKLSYLVVNMKSLGEFRGNIKVQSTFIRLCRWRRVAQKVLTAVLTKGRRTNLPAPPATSALLFFPPQCAYPIDVVSFAAFSPS